MGFNKTETQTSLDQLSLLCKNSNIKINLMGGWAVHFHVNEIFYKREGREYVGSRDIDLAFPMELDWDLEKLQSCELKLALESIKNLGFVGQGFRMYKNFHYDSGKEISHIQSKDYSTHELFKMCIDPMVPCIPVSFRSVFGFDPIDEPLLKFFFNANHKKDISYKEFFISIPSRELMASMKLNSSNKRVDKIDKRSKDIADFFVLVWYSDIDLELIKSKIFSIIEKNTVSNIVKKWDDESISRAANFININSDIITKVVKEFI